MPVRKKEFRSKGVESGVQEFLRGGNVDFAVFNAKVVPVNQECRGGKTENAENRDALGASFDHSISSPEQRIGAARDSFPHLQISPCWGRQARTAVKPIGYL